MRNANRPRGYAVAQEKKRVFIAFAKEDERMRDLLKGQSLNTRAQFEYVDMSVKEPYSSAWKTKTRVRIKGSDGCNALLSRSSPKAEGQLWEIQCAVEEKVPLLGIWCYKGDRTIPSGFPSSKTKTWTWENVAHFIDGL
jgi:hypothetical protein